MTGRTRRRMITFDPSILAEAERLSGERERSGPIPESA